MYLSIMRAHKPLLRTLDKGLTTTTKTAAEQHLTITNNTGGLRGLSYPQLIASAYWPVSRGVDKDTGIGIDIHPIKRG